MKTPLLLFAVFCSLSATCWAETSVQASNSFTSARASRLVQRISPDYSRNFAPAPAPALVRPDPVGATGGNPMTTITAGWEGIGSDLNFEPPDPSGAVGPNGVLATVNLRLAYYNKSGTAIWGPIDHPAFFSSVGMQATNILSDPHTLFDRGSGRFYTVLLEVDDASSNSFLNIAISKNSDPRTTTTNDWLFYRINDTQVASGLAAWTDYPGLGFDGQAIYVTYNMYTFPVSTAVFADSVIITLDKKALLNGTTNYNFTYTGGFTLQPCSVISTNNSPANVAYFGETVDNTHVRVWALSDPLGTHTATSIDVTVPNNGGFPPNFAPQPGTTLRIPTGATRTQGNAFWFDNNIWFCHTAGGAAGKSLAYYYNISLNGFPNGTPTLAEEGSIDGGPGEWTYQPSIGCNALGDVAMVYCQSSSTRYPTIFGTTRKAGSSHFDTPVLIKASPAYYFGGRWGDFASVTADPVDESFWVTHEWAHSIQVFDWSTWWANLEATLSTQFGVVTNFVIGGNGNGMIDPNECNNLSIVLTNTGSLGGTNITANLSTTTRGVIVAQRTSAYPNLPPDAGGTNLVPFAISTSQNFVCGTPIILSLLVKCDQGTSTLTLRLPTGSAGVSNRFDSTVPVAIPDNDPAGASSPITVSNFTGGLKKVSVGMYINHPFDGDLFVTLIAPDGTTNVLSANASGNGSSLANFGLACAPDSNRTLFDDDAVNPISAGNPPFLGAFKPETSFAVFEGKAGTNVNGIWQLHAVDSIQFGVGSIQCWSLFLSPGVCSDGGGQCPGVDLSIGMTPTPEPVFVGSNLLYTITMTNAGPDLAKNAVVSQTFAGSVIYVSGSASQGSVSQSGGVVTANLGNLAAGATATILVTVTPALVGLLSSTATITSQNNDFDLSNNSVTVTSHVNPPFADLAVSLLDAPDPVLVGQTLTYTVSVNNRGPSPASFVTVTNTLPVSVGILDATPSQGFVTISGNVVVCNFGTIPNSGVATATIHVVPALDGIIVATATATAAQIDPILGNNSATATTIVGPSTDLAIGIVDVPDPAVLRSNLTYIISVTNRGPSSASGVVIHDTLPAGVSVVSTNSSQGSITVLGSTVTCNLGNMTNSARATLTIVVTSTNSGTIFNTANVTGDQADPDPSNNSATASTVVSPPFVSFVAERAVLTSESLSPTNGTVDPGETVTVNLYLRNAGNVVNTNLFATLLAINGVTAPSGTQNYGILAPSASIARPFSFTASGAPGASIVATLQLKDVNIAQSLTNNLGNVTFTFVLPSTVTFANTNRIDIPTTLQDQQQPGPAAPYPSPITVSGVTGLVGKVTVTLSNLNHTFPHDLNFLLVGPNGAKALLMSHAAFGSSADAVDLTFDDSAPSALPASGGITSGAWQPSVYDPAPTFTNPAPAGPYNSVLSVFNGPITNGDWLLFANDDSAGDFGAVSNGWALTFTILNPVNQIADLLAAASVSPNPVFAGNNLTNVFSITNAGPNDASLVWVTNVLSPNEVLVSADNTLHAAFTTNGNVLLCNVGGLAAGASVRFTIVVSPTAAGSIINTASVTATSGEVDLNPANNSASAIATANLPHADLGVSISANPNPVTVGSNITATIVVTNSGPNAALNVTVSNPLPPIVSYVSGSASQGTVANLSGVVVANLGTISSGGSATITFGETPLIAGSITNTAQVSSIAVDGNSANNTASAISTVLNPAPLILVPAVNLTSESVLPANGTLDAGETVTANFTFTNSGAADTINLVATLLPTNGVTSPSGPANIGALVHGGVSVSSSFTFTAGSAPSGVVTATFQLQDGGNDLGLATFAFQLPTTSGYTNNTGITIPDHGSASPYPSTISVSGLTGVVDKVTVSLNGVTHGFPDDIDIILVSPSGQKVVVMSDTGGGHPITNVNLTFDDSAASGLPDSTQIVSGTYKPTDFEPGDNFPPPAPAGPVSTFLSAFNGSNPNGNWSLYVVDDAVGDAGNIAGWSLAITTINPVNPAVNLVVTVTDSPDPVFVGSGLTYTLTLTNRGPSTATGVLLSDSIAAGVIVVSTNTTSGTFSLTKGTVDLDVGTLAPGAGLVATLRVSPSLAGVIPNTATAINSPAQVDLDLASNTASTSTTVLSPLPAALAIESAPGQQFQITVTGQSGQVYTVQGSVNFTSWTPVFTGTISSAGAFRFSVPNSSNYRFFRAVRVP